MLKDVRLFRRTGMGKGQGRKAQRRLCDAVRDDVRRLLVSEGIKVEDVRFLTIWS